MADMFVDPPDQPVNEPSPMPTNLAPTAQNQTAIMSGSELIAAERQRQVDDEGWTSDHDDEHSHVELSSAAACYIDAARSQMSGYEVRHPLSRWPWHDDWWKPSTDPIRNLVKAGALIAAEIDRLQRANQSGSYVEPQMTHSKTQGVL